MTALDAAIQIRSLRAQLNVLEARLCASPEPQGHTLADLRGLLQYETPTTLEEIDAARYYGTEEPQQ